MPGLVPGDDPLLLLGDRARRPQPGEHTLERVLDVGVRDAEPARTGGADRGFVEQILEIGARQARGRAGNRLQVDVVAERLLARMDLEDRLATHQIGRRDVHDAVEAAGPEQCDVERIELVGRCHDDDAGSVGEPVQLDEQLVQRLVLLAVERVA